MELKMLEKTVMEAQTATIATARTINMRTILIPLDVEQYAEMESLTQEKSATPY